MLRQLQVPNSVMAMKRELSKKLARVGQVERIRQTETLPDIEDAAPVRSPFFSPIQTRHQRKRTWNPVQKYELPPKNSPVKKEPKASPSSGKLDTIVLSSSDDESSLDDDQPGKWEPANWRDVLDNIRKMRSQGEAPVDTMGCHKCSDENADEKTQRFQKLVALMLSSQTKDEVTYQAMLKLRAHNLTPESIVSMVDTKLEDLLHPVSFYRNKAKYLRQTAKILIDKYDSDIPHTIRDMVALPGVGPKMAHICMATAWQEITGIGVDVHVHRISNRLRWTPKETKDPEKTRHALEEWVPRELWGEVNHLLVGFGQTVCTPLRPHCADCLNRELCPSAFKSAKKPTLATKELTSTPPIVTKVEPKLPKKDLPKGTKDTKEETGNTKADLSSEKKKPTAKGKKMHL